MTIVFEGWLYAIVIALWAVGKWLLGAGVVFERWLCAVPNESALISFLLCVSIMSVLYKNVGSYDIVESEFSAIYKEDDIVFGVIDVLVTSTNIGFILA